MSSLNTMELDSKRASLFPFNSNSYKIEENRKNGLSANLARDKSNAKLIQSMRPPETAVVQQGKLSTNKELITGVTTVGLLVLSILICGFAIYYRSKKYKKPTRSASHLQMDLELGLNYDTECGDNSVISLKRLSGYEEKDFCFQQ